MVLYINKNTIFIVLFMLTCDTTRGMPNIHPNINTMKLIFDSTIVVISQRNLKPFSLINI